MTAMIERPSVDMSDFPTGYRWAEDGALYYKRPNGEHEHTCHYCRGEWDCDADLRRDGTCATFQREHDGHCSAECQRQTARGRTWRTERIKVATHRGHRTAQRRARAA